MVYINTLMLQRVLARPQWSGKLTARDRNASALSETSVMRVNEAQQILPGRRLAEHLLYADQGRARDDGGRQRPTHEKDWSGHPLAAQLGRQLQPSYLRHVL